MSGIEVPPGVILFEDPPLHDLHRRLLSKVFTPRRMEAIEPLTRQYCVRALDPLIGSGRFDFIADLGAQIPMRTIGYLLGIPEQDQQQIRDRTDRALGLKDGTFKTVTADMFENSYQLFAEYIDWRADHPSDDLMTQLLNAEIEEDGSVAAADPHRGAHLHQHDRRRRQRDDHAADRVHRPAALRTPRPTAAAGRRLLADPGGHRGGVALRGALTRAGAVCRPRHRMPWREDSRRLGDVVAQRVRQPRRAALPRRGALRHPPRAVRICRSGRVCTSVSGRRWRGCRPGWRSRRSSTRWPEWQVDYDNAAMAHTSSVRGWGKLPVVTG